MKREGCDSLTEARACSFFRRASMVFACCWTAASSLAFSPWSLEKKYRPYHRSPQEHKSPKKNVKEPHLKQKCLVFENRVLLSCWDARRQCCCFHTIAESEALLHCVTSLPLYGVFQVWDSRSCRRCGQKVLQVPGSF